MSYAELQLLPWLLPHQVYPGSGCFLSPISTFHERQLQHAERRIRRDKAHRFRAVVLDHGRFILTHKQTSEENKRLDSSCGGPTFVKKSGKATVDPSDQW